MRPQLKELAWSTRRMARLRSCGSAVNALVERIALFPKHLLVATKNSINYDRPSDEDLDNDVATINELRVEPAAEKLLTKFIQLTGNFQKNQFELDMPDDLVQLYE